CRRRDVVGWHGGWLDPPRFFSRLSMRCKGRTVLLTNPYLARRAARHRRSAGDGGGARRVLRREEIFGVELLHPAPPAGSASRHAIGSGAPPTAPRNTLPLAFGHRGRPPPTLIQLPRLGRRCSRRASPSQRRWWRFLGRQLVVSPIRFQYAGRIHPSV